MPLDPGTLRWRCALQRPPTGQDAAGQPHTTWVHVANFWADLRGAGGLEAIKADAPTSIRQVSIRLRWRTGITAGMRVVCQGTTYNILAVLPDLKNKEHVDLACEVVT